MIGEYLEIRVTSSARIILAWEGFLFLRAS